MKEGKDRNMGTKRGVRKDKDGRKGKDRKTDKEKKPKVVVRGGGQNVLIMQNQEKQFSM